MYPSQLIVVLGRGFLLYFYQTTWLVCKNHHLKYELVCLSSNVKSPSITYLLPTALVATAKTHDVVATPVQINDIVGPGALVQAVDILRDNLGYEAALLQLRSRRMRKIGRGC